MYRQDKEYMAEVGHLIQHPKLQKLKEIPHHIHSNRLEHSIHVSYTSYRISKKMGWDTKSTARGALLHDLFYYDWRQVKFNKSHAWVHPRIAVRNAKKITSLNKKRRGYHPSNICGLDACSTTLQRIFLVTWSISTGHQRSLRTNEKKVVKEETFPSKKC